MLNLIMNMSLGSNFAGVAPSPVHGDGVFAKGDIPPNTLVTTHPAHLVKIRREVDTYKIRVGA